jgi:uncharacterized protein YbdZ (MbtH family)
MKDEEDDPFETYKVVVNHEEQYSIWPAHRANALGWNDEGKTGTKQECLDHIETIWTDMRPLSLRKKMEELERNPPPPPEPREDPRPQGRPLVDRLCEGSHAVEVHLQPNNSAEALKACIDRGYVHIRFPKTKGGTELGVRLDRARSDLTQGNFEAASGTVQLVGDLTLDFVNVRCVSRIDLANLRGEGRLERT